MRPRRAPLFWRFIRWGLILTIWTAILGGAALIWFAHDLPRPEVATRHERRPAAAVLAADGSLLATQGDLFGEVLRLSDLPPYLPAALIAIEDRRFWRHRGLDPLGIARALWINWTTGEVVQGGSTLTQQLAKNLFLSPERSLRRKVQEALLALWLERRFSKEQILEIYLNRVYLGAGAYGVDAAARLFFGVSARRVTLWQAAVLAGLPQAPSRTNPRANPEAALARGREVLRAMVAAGSITEEQAAAAAAAMALPPRPGSGGGWFAEWVIDRAEESFPWLRDMTIRSTLDPRWQQAAEGRLRALLEAEGGPAQIGQGAVVVLDAQSGAVLAMVGGRDYRASPFNRAAAARRQPGSAFKAITYAAAIEAGASLAQLVSDAPLNRRGWSPGNGQWRSRGEITLEQAFAHSVNTAAVRVMDLGGGVAGARAMAERLGIRSRLPADASIALGTGEVTLLELAAAYAALVNGGRRVTPHGMRAILAEGALLPWRPPAPQPVLQPETSAAMRRLMAATTSYGTGRAAALSGIAHGGKTGTTQDYRDAWFIGFLGEGAGTVVIGIWLGNDHGEPMEQVRGGSLPARLFREIAEAARGR
ncbi:MAG: PBP1A family penicillin-binding protein [Rhodovarius sp.]|nr:PBP1A family penicillin-binding protein [Rhodovarius sp.]